MAVPVLQRNTDKLSAYNLLWQADRLPAATAAPPPASDPETPKVWEPHYIEIMGCLPIILGTLSGLL